LKTLSGFADLTPETDEDQAKKIAKTNWGEALTRRLSPLNRKAIA